MPQVSEPCSWLQKIHHIFLSHLLRPFENNKNLLHFFEIYNQLVKCVMDCFFRFGSSANNFPVAKEQECCLCFIKLVDKPRKLLWLILCVVKLDSKLVQIQVHPYASCSNNILRSE